MAFDGNPQIQVVKNFDEFEKYNDSYFRAEYFVNRLREEISENIMADCIEDIWLNIENIWIIKINCDDKTIFVQVDFVSKEIIEHTDFDFALLVQSLINSDSFATTHSMIDSLIGFTKYFSNKDIVSLIEAAVSNTQIKWIAEDNDVKNFFIPLYKAKSQIIPNEVRVEFNKIFLKEKP